MLDVSNRILRHTIFSQIDDKKIFILGIYLIQFENNLSFPSGGGCFDLSVLYSIQYDAQYDACFLSLWVDLEPVREIWRALRRLLEADLYKSGAVQVLVYVPVFVNELARIVLYFI